MALWRIYVFLLVLAWPSTLWAGSTSSTLNWSANTEADLAGYTVYRCTGVACTPTTFLATVAAPTTTYADSGLTPSTTYGYQIDAFDTTGHFSNKITPIRYYTTSAASPTIASNYIRDAGIGTHPDVVFSENFESSLATWSARFNGGGPSGIATSTDKSSASGGVQSARLIPSGTQGQLYRLLPSDYQTLYMRVYVKWLGSISHHAGVYMGGYETHPTFPQGDAGIKNGDRFISSIEQYGQQGTGNPNTRLDTYNNWVDMQGPSDNGSFYGRQMLVTDTLALNINTWQCFEMRIKVNTTVSGHQGELQIWRNDTEIKNFIPGSPTGAYDGSGNWVTGAGTGFPGLQWRDRLTYAVSWIKLQNYSDVGTPFDVLFDDLVVATSRIGCINVGGADTTPPGPVQGFGIQLSQNP